MGFRYYYVQVEKLFLPRFTRKSQSLCLFYGDIISIFKKKRVKSIQRINIDTAFFYYVITGIVRNTPIQNSQKIWDHRKFTVIQNLS